MRFPSILLVALSVGANIAPADELPRVLILGDSLYNPLSRTLAKEFQGRAKIVWKHPGDSTSALVNLDDLLGDEKWDVVHFNFGLADLHYRDPRSRSIRAMSKSAGGVRVTTVDMYEANLGRIAKRLTATGAKIVWASTTPIPSTQLNHIYDPGSEVEYNAVAAMVMAEHGIPVNDMHAYVVERLGDAKVRDPFTFGREIPLEPPIGARISEALGVLTKPRE